VKAKSSKLKVESRKLKAGNSEIRDNVDCVLHLVEILRS
jgi:hypothetical protein